MKGAIQWSILLIGWVLIVWGIFYPLSMECVMQNVLGLLCCGIGLGMSLERM